MDSFGILRIAGTAAQAAKYAMVIKSTGRVFYEDFKHIDPMIHGLVSEIQMLGSACLKLDERCRDIVTKHDDALANGFLATTWFWDCVELQVRASRETIDQLESALCTFQEVQGQSRGMVSRLWRHIKLNTKTKDIDQLRYRVRSQTAGLQIVLQAVAMELGSKDRQERQALLAKAEECVIRLKALHADSIGNDDERRAREEDVIAVGEAIVSTARENLYGADFANRSLMGGSDSTALYDHTWLQYNHIDQTDFEANLRSVASNRPSVVSTNYEFPRASTAAISVMSKQHDQIAKPGFDKRTDESKHEGEHEHELLISEAKEALESGQSSFQSNNFKLAKKNLLETLKAIGELPTHQQRKVCDIWYLQYLLSVCAYHNEDPATAKSQLCSVVDNAPRVSPQSAEQRKQWCTAGHLLSIVCAKLGSLEEALQYCSSVFNARNKLSGRTHPDSLQSLALLARIFHLLGQTKRFEIISHMIPEAERHFYLMVFEDLDPQIPPPAPTSQNEWHPSHILDFDLDAGMQLWTSTVRTRTQQQRETDWTLLPTQAHHDRNHVEISSRRDRRSLVARRSLSDHAASDSSSEDGIRRRSRKKIRRSLSADEGASGHVPDVTESSEIIASGACKGGAIQLEFETNCDAELYSTISRSSRATARSALAGTLPSDRHSLSCGQTVDHTMTATFHDSGCVIPSTEHNSIPDDASSDHGSVRTDGKVDEVDPKLRADLVADFVEHLVDEMDISSLQALLAQNDSMEQLQDLLRDFSKVLQMASSETIHDRTVVFIRHQRVAVATELKRSVTAWNPDVTTNPTLRDKFAAIETWRAAVDDVWAQSSNTTEVKHGKDKETEVVLKPSPRGDGVGMTQLEQLEIEKPTNSSLVEGQQDSKLIEDQPQLQEISAARAFLLQSQAYQWLVRRLQQLASSNCAELTSTVIRKQLTDKIATTSDAKSLVLSLEWDPVTFSNRQFRQQKKFSTVLVYCGSPNEPFVTTTRDYLHITWPTVAQALLDCFEELCKQAGRTSVNETVYEAILEHAGFAVVLKHGFTHLKIWGQGADILDLTEAFLWLSVACRENRGKECVGTATALLRSSTNREIDFHVDYDCADIEPRVDAIGYCWVDMVHNPVVATGYPTPYRQHSEQGLELAFDVMLALSRTDWATRFGNTLLIKGVISALVPVLDTGASVIWHFVLNKDNARLSYDQIPSHHSLPYLTLGNMDDRRHFVGMWTTSAQVLAGTSHQELYRFNRSRSDPIDHYTATLSGLGMNIGKILTVSANITLAKKDIAPPFRSSEGHWYERQIVDASNVTVLCYGQEDRRGWLLDGASALMHLSRAWLTSNHYSRLIPQEVLGKIHYVAGDGGKNAAIDALIENKRRNVCIFTSEERKWERTQPVGTSVEAASSQADHLKDSTHKPLKDVKHKCKVVTSEWTFKHLVIEMWRTIEDMSDKLRVMKLTQPEAALKQWTNKPILVGWEICDILSMKGPYQPRAVKLEPDGKDWLSYAREASAVVILARTFGNLIKPSTITTGDCWRESNMPIGKDYLAVPLDLWRESALLGDPEDCSCGSVQLTDYTYWHGFDPFCDSCTCRNSQYCNVVSHLGHKHVPIQHWSAKARLPVNVFNSFPQGATIIGSSRKLQKRHQRNLDAAGTHLCDMASKHEIISDRPLPADSDALQTELSASTLDSRISRDSLQWSSAQLESSMTSNVSDSHTRPSVLTDTIIGGQFSKPVDPQLQDLSSGEDPGKVESQNANVNASTTKNRRTGERPTESFLTRLRSKADNSLWRRVKGKALQAMIISGREPKR